MRCFNLAILAVISVACSASSASAQYAQTVLADNPFVYFRLQEPNAQHTDVAVNSSTQAGAANGVYLRNSGINGSFVDIPSIGVGNDPAKQFNRANDNQGAFIFSDQPATKGALSDFTISMLIRPENYSTGAFQALYASNGFSTGAVHLNLVPNGAGSAELELAVAGTAGAHPRIDLESLVALDEWAHLAVTYESGAGQNTISYFVNGDLIDTVIRGGDPAANFDIIGSIGSWEGTTRAFQGGLDEFAIFDTALSAQQIQAQSSALVPEPASIALWTLLGLAAMAFGVWKKRIFRG